MKRVMCLSAAVALLLFLSAASGSIAKGQDLESESAETSPSAAEAAIEATIHDYIEGWYEGDAERMDRALHPDLVKRIPVGGGDAGEQQLRAVSKERMVELTQGGGGESPGAEFEIEIHHVYGKIASAQARSVEYLDYLHLVETESGWKIANILFRKHD